MVSCLFCNLLKEKKLNLIYEDDQVVAFPDIEPASPVHILIIPRKHIASINDVVESDEPLLGHLFTVAKQLAKEHQIDQSGYRVQVNTGEHAGQTVFHLHMHLVGGEPLHPKH